MQNIFKFPQRLLFFFPAAAQVKRSCNCCYSRVVIRMFASCSVENCCIVSTAIIEDSFLQGAFIQWFTVSLRFAVIFRNNIIIAICAVSIIYCLFPRVQVDVTYSYYKDSLNRRRPEIYYLKNSAVSHNGFISIFFTNIWKYISKYRTHASIPKRRKVNFCLSSR